MIAILFLAIISKFLDESNVKWMTLIWLIYEISSQALFGSFTAEAVFTLLLTAPLIYLWLHILSKYNDTILTYFIIMFLGIFALYYTGEWLAALFEVPV